MKKVPRAGKEEWSDDSSDDGQMTEEEEDEHQLHHKPARLITDQSAHTDDKNATSLPGSTVDTEFGDRSLTSSEVADQDPTTTESATTAAAVEAPGEENATAKKRRSKNSLGWRFPKVARADLKDYVFLAACVKHSRVQVRPDIEAVGKELDIAPLTVNRKMRKLKMRMNEEGVGFGYWDTKGLFKPGAFHRP